MISTSEGNVGQTSWKNTAMRSVLLLLSACLKIPSRGFSSPAGQTPSVLRRCSSHTCAAAEWWCLIRPPLAHWYYKQEAIDGCSASLTVNMKFQFSGALSYAFVRTLLHFNKSPYRLGVLWQYCSADRGSSQFVSIYTLVPIFTRLCLCRHFLFLPFFFTFGTNPFLSWALLVIIVQSPCYISFFAITRSQTMIPVWLWF